MYNTSTPTQWSKSPWLKPFRTSRAGHDMVSKHEGLPVSARSVGPGPAVADLPYKQANVFRSPYVIDFFVRINSTQQFIE